MSRDLPKEPSIGATGEHRVRICWEGEEWILPPDLCVMLQSRMSVADRFRRVSRECLMRTTQIVFVTEEGGE